MKIRIFWNILLKILGIYLLLKSVNVIGVFLNSFAFIRDEKTFYISVIIMLSVLLLYWLVIGSLIFKSNWIINLLRLDKGFEEESVSLNFKLKPVLTIAIIVTGAVFFVEGLPSFCQNLFQSFILKKMLSEHSETGLLIFSFVKILIGLLMISNCKVIAGFIAKRAEEVEE